MKIVEAVLFNDELELLEARFQEGKNHVDEWVIIESSTTFTGNPKPLHFVQHSSDARFAPFKKRVRSVVVSEPLHIVAIGHQGEWRTETYETGPRTPWDREAAQRNALSYVFDEYDDDDLVVLSDGDELTRASIWPELVERTSDPLQDVSLSLHKPTWYYTLTWRLDDVGPLTTSYRSKAARVATIQNYGPPSVWANDYNFPVVYDSGWHLSCLGGPARLLEKFQSFSHQEINTQDWATYENCQRLIQEGIDCAPSRNVTLTRTPPAGPAWLVTQGVKKYPWLMTGEDPN